MSPLFKKSSGKWLHELERVVQGIFFDLFKHKRASKKYIYICCFAWFLGLILFGLLWFALGFLIASQVFALVSAVV